MALMMRLSYHRHFHMHVPNSARLTSNLSP